MQTQTTLYQLTIPTTRDNFIMDAKSLAAAQEEARNLLADFCKDMTPRARLNITKAARIETHVTTNSNPAFLFAQTLKATCAVTR